MGRRSGLPVIASAVALACGSSPITPERIEASLATTFANLVQVQVSALRLPAMAASEFGVAARCRKVTPGSAAGSGDWICTLDWQGPNQQALRDTYDLAVATDGCYTATVEGSSLGGPTLKRTDGGDVKNLLYKFEGCFDTTSARSRNSSSL
jgi:hypothetical protein